MDMNRLMIFGIIVVAIFVFKKVLKFGFKIFFMLLVGLGIAYLVLPNMTLPFM